MSGTPPHTHTNHPVAYYEHQRSSNSSSPAHYYPRGPPLQRPPAVHVTHAIPHSYGRYQSENAHAKTSVSSATSASSAASELKPYHPIQHYHMASQAERGYVQHSSRSPSHMSPPLSHVAANSNTRQSEMVEDHSAVIRYLHENEIDDERTTQKDHAIWILFWLSFLDPFHSLLSCFFTIIALLGLILLTPFRLCQKDSSFSTSLIRTVAPLFRNHLQMIYAPSVKNAHNFDFSASTLVLVHVASPILSFGIAFFSWIAAVFWLFALIMGNPDGTEKRDDGRATVIGVRNWWEKYFLRAIRR